MGFWTIIFGIYGGTDTGGPVFNVAWASQRSKILGSGV